MSLIRVDNFGPSAGGTTYSAGGIAKAWVNFNGTGTIAVRDSENVASLTDYGTGRYRANFSSVFGAGDYSAVVTPRNEGGSVSATLDSSDNFSDYIIMRVWTSAPALVDVSTACITCHGDLA